MSATMWGALTLAAAVLAWPARAAALPPVNRARTPRGWSLTRSDPEAECLEVLDALITLLRAGSAAAPALLTALEGPLAHPGHTSDGWSHLRRVVVQDGDVVEAWRELGRRWRSAAFTDVAAAWYLSARCGSPLAAAMQSAAQSVRARRSHVAAVDAATAGARASAGVLQGLPVLGVGLGLLLGVDMLACYRGISGFVTLWPGLVLMAAGSAWTRRMTAGALKVPKVADR